MSTVSTTCDRPTLLRHRPFCRSRHSRSRFRWLQHWRERRMEKSLTRFAERLQLNGEQQKQLRQLLAQIKEIRRIVQEEGQGLASKWGPLLHQVTFDQPTARALLGESVRRVQQQAECVADAVSELVDHLDISQRQQLETLLGKRFSG